MRIPGRTATDSYLARMGLRLDVVFDVDLGELIKGHHVVARGLMYGRSVRAARFDRAEFRQMISASDEQGNGGGFLGRRQAGDPDGEEQVHTEAELHYEFVSALGDDAADAFRWYWKVYASDDAGTDYHSYNTGAFDGTSAGPATHGTRDLGGQIPAGATRLTLRFEPPPGWEPPEPWRREIVIDLVEGQLAG